MTLPEASPPDVVLAKQKDDYYRTQLVDHVADATDAVMGAHSALVLRPELRLVAESLLMGATMLRGNQTPGEEYCDLLLVDQDTRRMGETMRHRLPLFVLVVGVPYFLRRYEAGGWAQLKSVFSPLSAHQRAAQIRKSMQERQATLAKERAEIESANTDGEKVNQNEKDESAATKHLRVLTVKLKRMLASFHANVPTVTTWLAIMAIVQRAHLAMFYLNGTFPELPFRLANLRYVFTREPRVDRPSYTILGMLIMVQLALQSVGAFRNKLKERGNNGHSGEDATNASLVPCLAEEEVSAGAGNSNASAGMAGKCGICLEVMTAPSCPPCGHLYCYECIVESLTSKAECPLCRQSATPSSVLCVYYHLNT